MLAADFGHVDIVKVLCAGSGGSGGGEGLKQEGTGDGATEEGNKETVKTAVPQACDVDAALRIARAKGMRDAETLLLSYLA